MKIDNNYFNTRYNDKTDRGVTTWPAYWQFNVTLITSKYSKTCTIRLTTILYCNQHGKNSNMMTAHGCKHTYFTFVMHYIHTNIIYILTSQRT